MKTDEQDLDDLRPEYTRSDFGAGVRAKYAALFRNTVMVRLDPDVATVFSDAESVNDALRALIVARASARQQP